MLGVLGLATLGAPSKSNAGKKYENKQGRDNFSTTENLKNCLTTKKFETVRFRTATKVALMQCFVTRSALRVKLNVPVHRAQPGCEQPGYHFMQDRRVLARMSAQKFNIFGYQFVHNSSLGNDGRGGP